MKDILIARFEEILPRYAHVWEQKLRTQYERAKDKEYVKGAIRQSVNEVFWSLCTNTALRDIIADFISLYKKGETPAAIFNQLSAKYNTREIVTDRDKELHDFLVDDRQAIKLFIRCAAYQEIEWRIPSILNGEPLSALVVPVATSTIQWVCAKDNKNEFVQLIYGLYHAGYLRTDTGEITKIVETLAAVLNVGLSKNWQSNHSGSVHKTSEGYHSPIFKKIGDAYDLYIKNKLKRKKLNK